MLSQRGSMPAVPLPDCRWGEPKFPVSTKTGRFVALPYLVWVGEWIALLLQPGFNSLA
ncbi:hypothetical protein [Kamptonema formosum]|uniref:hypothetical protein n=1 Tax=Kamptonema formosum TaxID=331992 RepID=UPI000345BF5D|nr:hypothetical protein [Oscillatoria sp. PCC 10802]